MLNKGINIGFFIIVKKIKAAMKNHTKGVVYPFLTPMVS